MHSYSAGVKNEREMGRSGQNRGRMYTNTGGRGRNGGYSGRPNDQNNGPARSHDHRNSRQRENSEQNGSNYTEAECGKCSQEVKEDDWALFCESERKWYISYRM